MNRRLPAILGLLASLILTALGSAPASAEKPRRFFDPVTRSWMSAGILNRKPAVKEARRSDVSPIRREVVAYDGPYNAGTIVVDTGERRLYFVLGGGKAIRYGVGVGREGFQWAGSHRITRKAEWPGWTPPPAMRKRQPNLPAHMAGGPGNPLGARAMYIGSTLYRIHGTSEPWTIGQAVSSGCIRMANEDVIDLYGRVKVGTKVVVRR